ncbi:MAG TPA: enoyl-ACP reductase [Candidatus Sulfomarinibacteraceae bacterium]|nr:enoyl-ACP reductase [Candidatus Sulfomarinibacteraceae bacterium]
MRPSRGRSREHDVVLWGATGFTGSLVAEALVERLADTGVRLALGGRRRGGLEALRGRLAGIDPAAAELPLVVADSHDRPSLDALAASADVVCTTVGPYAKHGHELVAACVDRATDYCDLTGEVPFVRDMIDRHHEAAQEVGARIVHCCGFDSVPSDLGVLMLQEAALERHGRPLDDITFVLGGSRGGVSGGTVASMLNVVEEARASRELRRLLADPYALNPEGERHGPDGPDLMRPRFDDGIQRWTGPFVMASVNTRVVRRSNALQGWRYGRAFRYREVTGFRPGLRGAVAATALTAGLGALMGALGWGPTRSLLERTVLPSPGEGPSAETRERGYFSITLHSRGPDHEDREVRLTGKVRGDRDPGYGATAVMLAESALCLALDGGELPSGGGVLTPAAAMGMRLVERLRQAGMVFEVR